MDDSSKPPRDTLARERPTRERILDAAEGLLQRHGPAKTGVVDIARALEMSHANVYRHFASKAALFDAVVERWLHRVSDPLAAIAATESPAPERLEQWIWALIHAKRRKVLDDPELFAAYHQVAEDARATIDRHIADLRAQIERIVRDGVASGAFHAADPAATAGALLTATSSFHHPHFLLDPLRRATDADVTATLSLLLAGLAQRPTS